MRPRVFFYVQHLLGVGHLMRAAAIAKATAALDINVLLVSGGLPHRGLDLGRAELFQLPPLSTQGTTYATLVDDQNLPIDETFRAKRLKALLERFETSQPHMVLTEHFPFGRGKLRFELLPLLDAVRAMRPKPLLFASVRDIIEPPESSQKSDRFLATANDHYDAILIHGDPDFAPLKLSFPDAQKLKPSLHYTGYVSLSGSIASASREKRILISAGNGRTGGPLIETILAAHKKNDLGMAWEVRLGAGFPEKLTQRLQAESARGLSVAPATPHFARDLAAAALSVSQAGYNTVVDIAVAGTPAVLVPYAGHGEREQGLRARQLARAKHAIVMDEKSLSPETLLPAMTQALDKPP